MMSKFYLIGDSSSHSIHSPARAVAFIADSFSLTETPSIDFILLIYLTSADEGLLLGIQAGDFTLKDNIFDNNVLLEVRS